MARLTRRGSSARRTAAAALACFASAVAACGASAAAEVGSSEPAQWVLRKIDFTYLGFTTHYSCDGLRDKVRLVLLELGAREQGLNVHEGGCTATQGGPDPFPTVVGTFYALQAVPADQAGGSGGHTVAAHWRTVRVRLGDSTLGQAGQCELLEQVKERILPLFDARNVRFRTDCVPHQLTLPGAALEVDVLKPDPPANRLAQAN